MNIDKRHILFGINSIACLFLFIAICVSVGFSKSPLILINGVFFIVYILSLWNTSTDTLELYDKKYFVVDMLSIAIYANIPRLFIVDMSINQFFVCFWFLFALNEAVCIGWDFISHSKAGNDKAKNFHIIWTILTFAGIIFMILSIVLIYAEIFQEQLVLLNTINIVYQFSLLLAWWISKYYIERKNKT